MSKKKRFSVSSELHRGLSETISVVENNKATYRNAVIPLSRVALDPDNPRQLAITLEEVRNGLDPHDPLYILKKEEFKSLQELAQTITSSGLINPIIVYKQDQFYRVVAGERRTLASTIANLSEIEARVFNEKPSDLDIKKLQWVENMAREDLSLAERLGNIKDIVDYYLKQHGKPLSSRSLEEMIGVSKTQAASYLRILKAPVDLVTAVKTGAINNLDKASLIAGVENDTHRKALINKCINGISIDSLRSEIESGSSSNPSSNELEKPRSMNLLKLGVTHNPNVVRHIMTTLLEHDSLQEHRAQFTKINWNSPPKINQAFKKLISLLEQKIEETV